MSVETVQRFEQRPFHRLGSWQASWLPKEKLVAGHMLIVRPGNPPPRSIENVWDSSKTTVWARWRDTEAWWTICPASPPERIFAAVVGHGEVIFDEVSGVRSLDEYVVEAERSKP